MPSDPTNPNRNWSGKGLLFHDWTRFPDGSLVASVFWDDYDSGLKMLERPDGSQRLFGNYDFSIESPTIEQISSEAKDRIIKWPSA